MNVALFGRTVSEPALPYLQELIVKLEKVNGKTCIYEPFYRYLEGKIIFSRNPELFLKPADFREKIGFLCSIGGDGTILDAVTHIGDSGIPVIGINTGRMGFLASIPKEEIIPAIDDLLNKKYSIEKRTLLEIETDKGMFTEFPYALNDLTIYRSENQTMLTIRTLVNGDFLNSYWADGLIVATPTGSTAYSLSCTGPIITPDAGNFVITPIASHNLTVRPIVLRDDSIIRISAEGTGDEFFINCDSRREKVTSSIEVTIRKANFHISLLRLNSQTFYKTIREKLNWGLDVRN